MSTEKPVHPQHDPKTILLLIPMAFGAWLFLTSTTRLLPGFSHYDAKRLLELCLITLTLSSVLMHKSAREHFNDILTAIPAWVRVLIIVFFGLGIASALRTPHPAYPLVGVAMLLLMTLTIMAVACIQQIASLYFDRVILACIALMGLTVFVQELAGLAAYHSLGRQFNYLEAFAYFFHPRFYNHLQTWTLPLIVLLPIVFSRYRWIIFLSIFLLAAQWYILISMGARGSTVSLLVAMLIIGMVLPKHRKYWLKLHTSGLMLGVVFYLSVVGLLDIAQPGQDEFVNESIGRPMLHTTGRTYLWKLALEDAKQNPWLGAGPMRFACGSKDLLPGSPHSFPVQILGEWGIPAFLVLSAIFAWLFHTWFRNARSTAHETAHETAYKQAAISCLSISFVAAIIHACVSSLHIAPASQVAGMVVLGWLLGCLHNSGKETIKNTFLKYSGLILLLGLLISISVLVFSNRELGQLPFRTSYAKHHGPTMPGFWENGRFCEYSF